MVFSGTNPVCRQCIGKCKQFAQVELVACPKFQANPKYRGTSSLDQQIPQARKKRGTIKRILRDAKKKNTHSRRLVKARGLCPVCKKKIARSRHHIKPIADGGMDVKRNTVYLCNQCHNIVEEYTRKGKLYSPVLIELIRLKRQ